MAGQQPEPVRVETVEEWGQRALAEHGPMPEHLVQRLRRVIAGASAARTSSPAASTASPSRRRAS
ncbi:hypothetical protein ACPPVT_07695 [Angustibacter sp. McL0619]|uniref:hypothetical protein n=1 Tax=Angustibacter sp. McL0619 TaxID=3415676 RepID=UPI003CF59C49